jgi:hypothetical protein
VTANPRLPPIAGDVLGPIARQLAIADRIRGSGAVHSRALQELRIIGRQPPSPLPPVLPPRPHCLSCPR